MEHRFTLVIGAGDFGIYLEGSAVIFHQLQVNVVNVSLCAIKDNALAQLVILQTPESETGILYLRSICHPCDGTDCREHRVTTNHVVCQKNIVSRL